MATEEAEAPAEDTTATATDITQPIRFLPTPKNNDDDEADDDGVNNDPSSTSDTISSSSTKRRGFGLGFRRRFRANKSTTTPSLPPP